MGLMKCCAKCGKSGTAAVRISRGKKIVVRNAARAGRRAFEKRNYYVTEGA
ncbi:MAG: hypothetical protein Q4A32_02700 [Lachnospiraceae bacterium]|nr:hypothetical protein [Lachnospiraceae bacterium]